MQINKENKMKKLIFLVSLLLIVCMASAAQIWIEDFSDNAIQGKGATGTGATTPAEVDLAGVTKWAVDISNVDNAEGNSTGLYATTDWWRVQNYLFEGRDLDGDQNGSDGGAIWYSESIDISGYSDVGVSLWVYATGGLEPADFIRASYQIDGGTVTSFGYMNDPDGLDTTWSVNGLSGSSLVVWVEADCNASGEYIRFDDVSVTGTPSSSETITTGAISTAPFNPGGTGTVAFTGSGTFANGATFTAQLSDGTGAFGSPTDIGTYTLSAETVDPAADIDITIPDPLPGDIGYVIRVVCDNPVVIGSDSAPFTVNGVTVTPAGAQYVMVGQAITPLTANIVGSAIQGQWAVSETSGGPYMPSGISDNPLSLVTPSAGKGYLVFAVMFAEGSIYSNEVLITTTEAPTIPYHEDFLAFPPAGWQNNSNWYSGNSSYAGGVAPEASIGYSSYAVGDNLVSCPINTSGYSSLDVTWCQSISTYSGGTGSFELGLFTSTDGINWGPAVWTYTYTGANDNENQGVTIYTTDGVGSPNLYLKFEFVAQDLNRLSYWNIDELVVKDSAENQDTEAVPTGDPAIDFDSPHTGIVIQFGGVTASGNVTVMFFNEGPINTNGITDENVSVYRWNVDPDDEIVFSEAWIAFDLDYISRPGIIDPTNVNVWHRSSEFEDFTMIDGADVFYDGAMNAIIARVDGFSEFVFGSDEETLPVELSGFHASYASEGYVSLQWMTQSESDMLGYHVLRSETDNADDALMITTNLVVALNSPNETSYEYEDTDVEIDNTYYYWLSAVELDGSATLYGPTAITIEDDEEETPDFNYVTSMSQNSPNPFNPTTSIDFSLQDDAHVTLKIYNSRGQLVKTLIDEERTRGDDHSATWNGTDDNNNSCGSGIYFYKLETGSKTITKKMMMIK